MNVLGVEGTCYQRGYEGKSYPRWAKPKPSPLWDWYQKGKKDAEGGLPSRLDLKAIVRSRDYPGRERWQLQSENDI